MTHIGVHRNRAAHAIACEPSRGAFGLPFLVSTVSPREQDVLKRFSLVHKRMDMHHVIALFVFVYQIERAHSHLANILAEFVLHRARNMRGAYFGKSFDVFQNGE